MAAATYLTSPLPWVLIAFLFAFVVRQAYHLLTRRRFNYPPGPSPDPIIGNVRQLPLEYQEKTFAKWRETYGDIVYIKIFGKPVVILNSLRAARDLLEKRSATYSDRPRFVLIAELMGWDCVVTHLPYGARFRKHRRWIQDGFNQNAVSAFRSVQAQEAGNLLDGLSKSPESFPQHVRRYAAGSILKVTYGHTVKSIDDMYIRIAEQAATATVEAGSPGSMIVDFFPALAYLPTWLPGTNFKRNALNVRRDVQKMLSTPFEMVKTNMKLGIGERSFTTTLLEKANIQPDGNIDPQDDEDIKGVSGVLYGGAVDTTVSVISTFLLAMVLHPEVHKKAQEEIDRVIGFDRLPDLNDKQALPYLECVLKEVYRWNPPLPLSIPHSVTEDDKYYDYHIPKGAIIIPNIWAMTRDPDIYSDPHTFNPDRFMGNEKADPREPVFGFGRRVCPGRFFGEANVWLAVASVTAAFSITKAIDQLGREITPAVAFTSGFVSHPKPFQCCIRPRSPKAMELINNASVVAD